MTHAVRLPRGSLSAATTCPPRTSWCPRRTTTPPRRSRGSGATPIPHICTGSSRRRFRPSWRPRPAPATPSCGRRPARSTACCPRSRAPTRWPASASTTRSRSVGARAGHRRDPRHVRRRPGPRGSVQRDGGGQQPVLADLPGYVREQLAKTLGGTAVIAMGTLGRQEGIGASPDYAEVSEQGRFVTNALMRALTHAHRITDTTLGAATQSFSSAAQNTGLLAAMSRNHLGGPLGLPGPATEPAGNNPGRHVGLARRRRDLHDRPLAGGSVLHIVARARPWDVGDRRPRRRSGLCHGSGEAFPEVTEAIQRSFATSDGVRAVHVIDHAGDQLGYYCGTRSGVYPAAQLAQRTSPSTTSGRPPQDNVDAVRRRATPRARSDRGERRSPRSTTPNAFSEPTIQSIRTG